MVGLFILQGILSLAHSTEKQASIIVAVMGLWVDRSSQASIPRSNACPVVGDPVLCLVIRGSDPDAWPVDGEVLLVE